MIIPNNVRYFDVNSGHKTPLDYLKEIEEIEKIEKVTVVVFSSGLKNIKKLISIIKEKTQILFIISGYIVRMQIPTYEFIKNTDSEIRVINTHCKFILIKTKENYYTITSTSNLDSNSKIEITEISNSKKEYDFFLNYFIKNSTKITQK